MSNTDRIQCKGVKYLNLKDLYDGHAANGLSLACVRQRLKLGWALETALTEPLNPGAKRKFFANGQVFLNLKALAKAAEISYEAAVKRHHRGFSDEEIFSGRVWSQSLATPLVPPPLLPAVRHACQRGMATRAPGGGVARALRTFGVYLAALFECAVWCPPALGD